MTHAWGRGLAAAATVTCVSLALAGCGDKGRAGGEAADDASATPTSASATATPSATTDPPSPVADEGEVTLLDPGSGDRQPLVLHLTEGERSTTTVQMTIATRTTGVDVPPIPMTMTMTSEVADVTAERSTVDVVYDGIDVDTDGLPPELVTELTTGLDMVDGLEMTFEYSPHGELLDSDISLPDGTPSSVQGMVDQIGDSMTSMGVAFPSEPLGEGARWQGESTVELAGMKVRQTTTYELVSFDGDSYTVAIKTRGALDPPQGLGATISKAEISTEGEMTGDLAHVLPSSATTHGTTSMDVDVAGKHGKVTTQIDMTMTTEVH